MGDWGRLGRNNDRESLAALHRAIDSGVNLLDTADVYGAGWRRALDRSTQAGTEEIVVATKAGRKFPEQTVAGYSRANLISWVEESLRNLATDCLDLLQLHCPPYQPVLRPEVFGYLDGGAAGKIRYYGVKHGAG